MPVLCNFIIYLVKMIFLLFVLDIMLKAPPSGVMGNSEEFCESQQTVACACYKQPKASCREAFCLIETHKVPVLNHCLVQLHYTDCSVLVQAPNIYIKKKSKDGTDLYVMTAILLPVKSESVFYSDYYITICRASASMGAFLWTSETYRQCFSGLHCHVRISHCLNSYIRF